MVTIKKKFLKDFSEINFKDEKANLSYDSELKFNKYSITMNFNLFFKYFYKLYLDKNN